MKIIKRISSWFTYKFFFLKVLNSPFKGLKLKWYFGKIQHGTPYFLPRKWVKWSKDDCIKAIKEKQAIFDKVDKLNPYTIDSFKNIRKPVPIKYFGFQFTTLGWKTKWNDYRFEWSPMISIVLFGKQICIWFMPNINLDEYRIALDCYWEAWLNYKYKTDKSKSVEKRLEELQKEYSCSWGNKEKGYTNYYPIILKNKYHYLIPENKL